MYIILYLVFFKIGLFAIGGGLATLPFLQEIVENYGWITYEELIDIIAISESTPGPIGINMATYTGVKTTGVFGGLVATLGIVTPSIIIIVLIAHYYMRFSNEPIVEAGFYGLRPAVTGLIGAAGFEVAKVTLFNIDKYSSTKNLLTLIDIKAFVFFVIMLILLKKSDIHPIFHLVGAAIVGIVFKF